MRILNIKEKLLENTPDFFSPFQPHYLIVKIFLMFTIFWILAPLIQL